MKRREGDEANDRTENKWLRVEIRKDMGALNSKLGCYTDGEGRSGWKRSQVESV